MTTQFCLELIAVHYLSLFFVQEADSCSRDGAVKAAADELSTANDISLNTDASAGDQHQQVAARYFLTYFHSCF